MPIGENPIKVPLTGQKHVRKCGWGRLCRQPKRVRPVRHRTFCVATARPASPTSHPCVSLHYRKGPPLLPILIADASLLPGSRSSSSVSMRTFRSYSMTCDRTSAVVDSSLANQFGRELLLCLPPDFRVSGDFFRRQSPVARETRLNVLRSRSGHDYGSARNSSWMNLAAVSHARAAAAKSTGIAFTVWGVSTRGWKATEGLRGIWALAPRASFSSTAGESK